MANGDLVKLTFRHRENSYNTQRARRVIVKMMAQQLGDMGFQAAQGEKPERKARPGTDRAVAEVKVSAPGR